MGDGDSAVVIRACVQRWREQAWEAVGSGGMSERNLQAFASGL
uniref:Uncharacterized protein n=1 Tax=Arundo donax TaxID=35708 RepID=A0A0A9GRL4_ARUDO